MKKVYLYICRYRIYYTYYRCSYRIYHICCMVSCREYVCKAMSKRDWQVSAIYILIVVEGRLNKTIYIVLLLPVVTSLTCFILRSAVHGRDTWTTPEGTLAFEPDQHVGSAYHILLRAGYFRLQPINM